MLVTLLGELFTVFQQPNLESKMAEKVLLRVGNSVLSVANFCQQFSTALTNKLNSDTEKYPALR
jgi:hypothetical protein